MTTAPHATLGYDAKRPELEQWLDRHYIEQFNLQPCTLVDVGCGDGFWAMLFDLRGFTVVGVDTDPDALHRARERTILARTRTRGLEHKSPVFIPLNVDDVEQLQVFADAYKRAAPVVGVPRAPELIFARTIPHFYQPTLDTASTLITRLLMMLASQRTTMLISVYSDGTGRTVDNQTHHPLGAILTTIHDAGGRIADAVEADGYMQIAVTRR